MVEPQHQFLQEYDFDPRIALSVFEAVEPVGKVVLINSAMGVKRSYYRHYASYLAENGIHAVTYDYQGIGESTPVEGEEPELWMWGGVDQEKMLSLIRDRFPDCSMAVVGHSVGGQIIGWCLLNEDIDGMLGIAAQSGYWRHWPGLQKYLMLTLWRVIIPVSCRLLGYLPGRILGSGENVPEGVAREWAKCGLLPGYIRDLYPESDVDFFDDLHCKLLLYSFDDDNYAPRKAVEALAELYPNAPANFRHVVPQEKGMDKIGHFGFFRQSAQPHLWAETLEWLLAL